jgi:hypothetical protein
MGIVYFVTTPEVVIRPIVLVGPCANHRAPSEPDVIPLIHDPVPPTEYSVTSPFVVILPILSVSEPYSANHRAPSEPVTIWSGPAVLLAGREYSVIVGAAKACWVKMGSSVITMMPVIITNKVFFLMFKDPAVIILPPLLQPATL